MYTLSFNMRFFPDETEPLKSIFTFLPIKVSPLKLHGVNL